MTNAKKKSYRLRLAILVIMIGLMPFLRPKTAEHEKRTESKKEEATSERKITILTDQDGRKNLIPKVVPFREKNPTIGIVLVLDERALSETNPDICLNTAERNGYVRMGKCFVNEGLDQDPVIKDFVSAINE